MDSLDDPARGAELRRTILGKPALKRFYTEIYGKYADCLRRCPAEGLAVELGSGGGFAQTFIPELITTDVIPYEDVERVVDATRMPFEKASVRLIAMLNVFHHIPDVAAFLREAVRCVMPGGRVLIFDSASRLDQQAYSASSTPRALPARCRQLELRRNRSSERCQRRTCLDRLCPRPEAL